jgi:hypothetical protein
MEPETFVRPRTKKARRRGPAPNTRLAPFEAAYVRLRMALSSLGFSGAYDVTGLRKSQFKNVLRRERGLRAEERARLFDALVSPFNASSGTFSPSQLNRHEQHVYAPLLSAGAAARTTAPTAHVSIDKLRLIGKLKCRRALLRYVPVLDEDPETKSAEFLLPTSYGPVRAFWERSKMDDTRNVKPWKRNLHFWHNLNLKAVVEGRRCTITKLSIDPFRKRCKEHTGKRGPHLNIPCDCAEHGERCPADHFEYNRPNNYGCVECASLTRSQPNFRFEVTGLGCQLGLLGWLGQSYFAPFVDPETITVAELHLAVDIAAPAACLLPFQRKLDGNRGFRTVVSHANDLDSIGLSWGSSARGFSVVYYDKKQHVQDASLGFCKGAAILPHHAREAKHTARVEFRFRPPLDDLDPTPEGVLSADLLELIGTFLVADLQHLEGATPLADLVCRARRLGFCARKPVFKNMDEWRTPAHSQDLRGVHFGPWLIARLRDARMHRKSAQQAACVLHEATHGTLLRLSERSGIDPMAIVEQAFPRIQAELNACVGIATASEQPTLTGTDSWAA